MKLHALSDATAAIAIARRLGPGRVRHLEVKQLWVQQAIQQGRLTIEHLPGANNSADLLTKALPRERHVKLSRLLGMRSPNTSFIAALPTQANEIALMSAFEVVEPHCCGELLTCRRCSSASSGSLQPRPKERAAALLGATIGGYGRPSAEALVREERQRQWNFVQGIFRQAIEHHLDCNTLAQAVLRARTFEELQSMLH